MQTISPACKVFAVVLFRQMLQLCSSLQIREIALQLQSDRCALINYLAAARWLLEGHSANPELGRASGKALLPPMNGSWGLCAIRLDMNGFAKANVQVPQDMPCGDPERSPIVTNTLPSRAIAIPALTCP